jgi:di/tricarboxylate transporter
MSLDAWLTVALLSSLFVLLIFTKFPPWAIFLGVLTLAITLKLAPENELLLGFSNSGVITVGALFVVAAGMYSTGAITLVADKLIGFPKSLRQAQLKILPSIAFGSAFLNNTPLVAMMIPVIRDMSRATRISVSKLLIPLSFASILGGAATLIGTSTNLIIAGLVLDEIMAGNPNGVPGLRPLNVFDPTWVGLPVAVVGLAYIIYLSARLLPAVKSFDIVGEERRLYRAEFVVDPQSSLIGKTLEEAGFANPVGYELSAFEHSDDPLPEEPPKKPILIKLNKIKRKVIPASLISNRSDDVEIEEAEGEDDVLQTGDVLTFVATVDSLPELWRTIGLSPLNAPISMDVDRHNHRLVEVVVAPGHPAVGKLVSDLPAREDSPYKVKLVALSRHGRPPEVPIQDVRIEAGDNAILEVDDEFFYENRNELEFLIVRRLRGYRIQRTDRAIAALLITLAMIVVATFGWLTMLNASLLAGFLMMATGCLSFRNAGRSVDFGTLIVLASAVGLASAVSATGLSDQIANLLAAIGGGNPYIALASVFVGTSLMANMTTNAAAAAVMFPISISLAASLQVNFMPFAIILMMGSSAFISPASYQTNLMVYGPGGYKFMDFVKVGFPLTIIVGVVSIFLAPLIFGF